MKKKYEKPSYSPAVKIALIAVLAIRRKKKAKKVKAR